MPYQINVSRSQVGPATPLQVCSKQSLIVNTVLILLLQSPWSSMTQGPLILWVLTQYAPFEDQKEG